MMYPNPHADDPRFIDLGTHVHDGRRYDLYAIVKSAGDIDLGARFGDAGPQYLSGTMYRQHDDTMEVYAFGAVEEAAVRMRGALKILDMAGELT